MNGGISHRRERTKTELKTTWSKDSSLFYFIILPHKNKLQVIQGQLFEDISDWKKVSFVYYTLQIYI